MLLYTNSSCSNRQSNCAMFNRPYMHLRLRQERLLLCSPPTLINNFKTSNSTTNLRNKLPHPTPLHVTRLSQRPCSTNSYLHSTFLRQHSSLSSCPQLKAIPTVKTNRIYTNTTLYPCRLPRPRTSRKILTKLYTTSCRPKRRLYINCRQTSPIKRLTS